jgi:hypothetical protein
MRIPASTAAKAGGLALGLLLAGWLVWTSRVEPGTGSLGADVIVAASPTGELAVGPTGPILVAPDLRPGRVEAADEVSVLNQTGTTLRVQVRGLPSTGDLDDQLWIAVETGRGQLFRGELAAFRDWTADGLVLAPGEEESILLSAWLADGSSGWTGRVEQVALEFRSTPLEVTA